MVHLARNPSEYVPPKTTVLQVTVQLAEALSWLAMPSTDGMPRLRAGSHQASHMIYHGTVTYMITW